MDRLNRMLQAAQGMGMGSAAPGGVSLESLVLASGVLGNPSFCLAPRELHMPQ